MFFLNYNQHLLLDDNEPSRFINAIEGNVGKYDDDVPVETGKFKIFVVDLKSATNENESVFRVFDTHHSTVDYYDLYTANLDFKASVNNALKIGHRWTPNLLILDRLEIYPEHRGQGDGLLILEGLIRRFAIGCGLVAMKPFPLQFEGGDPAHHSDEVDFIKLRLDQFGSDLKKSQKRLQDYYAKIGFSSARQSANGRRPIGDQAFFT